MSHTQRIDANQPHENGITLLVQAMLEDDADVFKNFKKMPALSWH